jgi:hypothetical protein
MNDADNPRAPDASLDVVAAELTQLFCDELRCPVHIEHKFGVSMQVTAPP